MDDPPYISIVLGETGAGKSSFINAITQKYECEVSPQAKACTIDFQIIEKKHKGEDYMFIDTPGLNDPKGDLGNITQIKSALEDYKSIRCILLLLKFQDSRLSDSTVKIFKNFMECFPLPEFWKHVLIIRTHANKKDDDFEDDREKIEGSIVKSLSYDEFKNFKNFMKNIGINLPVALQEFYVDCRNEEKKRKRTLENNKDEFEKIYNAIKGLNKMFGDIKTVAYDEQDKSGTFPKLVTMKKIEYYDSRGKLIKVSEPYPFKTIELCNYPFESKKWKEPGPVESRCRKKRTYYHHYEKKIYNINGKKVEGDKCQTEEGWGPWESL
jgi:GTP-binding protein EngB required for normal cell division